MASILDNNEWSTGSDCPITETLQRFIDNPPRWNYRWIMDSKAWEELTSGKSSLADLILDGRAWKEPYLESAPSASSDPG